MAYYACPMPWNLKHVTGGDYCLVNHTGEPASVISIRALDDDSALWQLGLGNAGAEGITDTAMIVDDGETVGNLAFTLGDHPSGVIDIEWTRYNSGERVSERLDAGQSLVSHVPE